MSGNVIGGVIGLGVSFLSGGLISPMWGWMLGSIAGGLLMPPEGPRLQDLKPQASEYGRPIPIVYGTIAVGGNVIWASDLTQSGGGGGKGSEPEAPTASANFQILICESDGDIALGRIWAGPEKRLVWDGATAESGELRYYNGAADQLPDPLVESYESAGNVPAYRGYATLVWEGFECAKDGNRIPFLTIEVGKVSSDFPASDLGTVWQVGEIFIDAAEGTYTYSYSGSYQGTLTRRLSDNVGISHRQWDGVSGYPSTGYAGNVHSFFDPDRNVIVQIDATSIFWAEMDSAASGSLDVSGTWPGLIGAGWQAVGGVYHGGNYCFLMHNTLAGGVAISVIDPDSLATAPASAAFYEGDAGFAVSGLSNFCGHRADGDAYILGVTKAGTVRKFPLSAGFTSTSCGACVASSAYATEDPNTGYVWTATLTSGTLDVACNDPVTQAQLYAESFATSASALGTSTRRGFPWIFNADDGRVLLVGEKVLATDYVIEFESGKNATPYHIQDIIGTYHGTAVLSGGWYNTATATYWFTRNYAWANSATTGNDLSSIALTGTQNETYPGSGFLLGLSDWSVSQLVEGEALSDVVSDLCVRAGLTTGQIDVTALASDTVDGYAVANQTKVRDAIAALAPIYFFDPVESGGVVKFVKRGGAIAAVIDDDELGAYESGSEAPDDLTTVRQMEHELPRVLTVKYLSRATDYAAAAKPGKRLVGASGEEASIEVPMVLTDTKGQQVADVNLHQAWVGRLTYGTSLPRKYADLEPTDIIAVKGHTMRITKITQKGGRYQTELVHDDSNIYTPNVVVTETTANGGAVFTPSPTIPALMNLVALKSTDTDAGFYAAACGAVPANWNGAVLYQSKDAGSNYSAVGTFSSAATMGYTTDALASYAGGDTTDAVNTVNVRLYDGELSSTTADGFLAGLNACAIGDQNGNWEIVYFRDATLEANGSYTLSTLKRGRLGSGSAIGGHVAGDSFVLLNTAVIRIAAEPSDIGQSYLYKAVSAGSSLTDAVEFEFTNTGAAYKPSAPVDVSQPATVFGHDAATSSGLEWAYYGGAKLKADGTIVLIPADSVTLTDNATNYLYATDAGVVTVTTVAPAGWPAPLASFATALYEVVTSGGVVVSYIDYRTAAGGSSGSASPLTTKGDLLVYTTERARLAVGTDGQTLKADSTQPSGVKWADEPLDVYVFYPGVMADAAVLLRVPIGRPFTIPADFAGAVGKASAAATGSTAIDVQKNGVSVGTITYGAAGSTATFATSGGTAVSFAAGDLLSIHGPATADATLADVGIVLLGVRT